MAMTIRCILKVKLSLLSNNITRQLIYNGGRTICSAECLGMTEYRKLREMDTSKYQTATNFMRKRAIESKNEVILDKDLRILLHLIERTPTDIDIMKESIERYFSQSNKSFISSFTFGPIVMRTLHYLNEADVAKQLFYDPKFETLFDQNASFLILLDLLYEHGKYQDVCDIYEKIEAKLDVSHVRVSYIAALACYKLNTPESLACGLKICQGTRGKNATKYRQLNTSVSALALNQDQPGIALELAQSYVGGDHISIRSVKVLALARLGRIDDLVTSFRNCIRSERVEKDKYFKDIIPRVAAALEKFDIDVNSEIHVLIQKMEHPDFVYESTLEEYLQRQILDLRKRFHQKRSGDEKWERGPFETRWRQPGEEGRKGGEPRFQDRESIYDSR